MTQNSANFNEVNTYLQQDILHFKGFLVVL